MKVKITYPAPDYEHKVGLIVDVKPDEAKRLLKMDWCIDMEDEPVKPVKKQKEVTDGTKPTQE